MTRNTCPEFCLLNWPHLEESRQIQTSSMGFCWRVRRRSLNDFCQSLYSLNKDTLRCGPTTMQNPTSFSILSPDLTYSVNVIKQRSIVIYQSISQSVRRSTNYSVNVIKQRSIVICQSISQSVSQSTS